MRRSILAGAVLAALLVVAGCAECGDVTRAEDKPANRSIAAPGGQREARIIVERRREVTSTCLRYCNMDACYTSEADTNVHRLRDCLPTGGCCCDCERVHRPCDYTDHCGEMCGDCGD